MATARAAAFLRSSGARHPVALQSAHPAWIEVQSLRNAVKDVDGRNRTASLDIAVVALRDPGRLGHLHLRQTAVLPQPAKHAAVAFRGGVAKPPRQDDV